MNYRTLLLINFLMGIASLCFAHAQSPGPLLWADGPALNSARAEAATVKGPGGLIYLMGGTSAEGNAVVNFLFCSGHSLGSSSSN